ncbi:ATP-grasp domain-containing protein [Catenulispora subtropica]|uniref:ATP-grasp domain-containing protein n=1 Tax=Catenulispora subtropica TaxID=450798 RepID=A0ABN2R6J4_9ACTN
MTVRVAILEPASSGLALVHRAAALGWQPLVASHDQGDRRLDPAARAAAARIITVDTNDETALAAAVAGEHRRAPIDGVVAGCEYRVPSAARISAALGLPGLDPATVDLVRDKPSMRAAVAAAGLAGPRFAELDDPADLPAACAHVGFPAVVKPADGCGSMGVRRVDDVRGARAAVAAILRDTRLDLGVGLGRAVIVEQYLSGPEFSADGFVADGTPSVVAVTRKLLGPEPAFVETGHLTPADLLPWEAAALTSYAEAVVRAVGVTRGPFHCELRLSPHGPVLMEVAARLPGDRITDLLQLTTGVDLPTVALAAATGRDPFALGAFGAASAAAAGIRFLTVPGAADWRDRVGHELFTADSPRHARIRWEEIGTQDEKPVGGRRAA